MFVRSGLASCIAVLVGFSASASAADLDNILNGPELPMTKPVEVGSGWYLRGDVGYSVNTKSKRAGLTVQDPFAQLGGLSNFNALSRNVTYSDFSGSVGIGYNFTDYLRADLNLGIMAPRHSSMNGTLVSGCAGTSVTETTLYDPITGRPLTPSNVTTARTSRNCDGTVSVESDIYTGMLNGYIDLATVAGITPYIGAGIGIAYSKIKVEGSALCVGSQTSTTGTNITTTSSFICDGRTSATDAPINYTGSNYKKNSASLAYSLNAGFGYSFSKNWTLDVGYQFMSAPNAEYAEISGGGVAIAKGIDQHQVRVGLRYDLW